MAQGDLYQIWECECGTCCRRVQLRNPKKSNAHAELARLGWINTADWGWICAGCDNGEYELIENDE